MAKSKIEVEVVATDHASPELKNVASEAHKLEGETVQLEVDADVTNVLSAFDQVAAEAKQAAQAAQVLSKALGPELAAKADVGSIVSDLQKMGLTLEQITANADQLGGKLRQLSEADVGGRLGANLGTTRGHLDEMNRSAGQSRAVLANMVGNSAQDLGQLAGVVGSAGVGIGQLAEYASEGSLSLAGMAAVAGPMAALGIVTAVISDHLQDIAKTKAFNTKQVEDYTKALQAGETELQHLQKTLEDTGKIPFVDDGDTKDASSAVAGLNLTVQDFQNLVKSSDATDTFSAGFDKLRTASEKYSAEQAQGVVHTQAEIDAQNQLLGILKDVNTVLAAVADTRQNQSDAIDRANLIALLTGKMTNDQKIETARELAHLNVVTDENTHLTDQAARAYIDFTKGMVKNNEETAKAAEAQLELSQRVDETNLSLHDMVDNLDQIEAGALAKALDPGDAALDALGLMQDLNKEARDFGDWLHEPETKVSGLNKELAEAQKKLAGIDPADTKEVAHQLSEIRNIQDEIVEARKKVTGTPDIFKMDPKSAEFLQRFAPIRDKASKELEDAFAKGGIDGAKAFADKTIQQLSQETRLRPEEVMGLLGWQDLTATLKVAIELSDVEKAKEQLGFLKDLFGPTETQEQRTKIFNISMALSTGKITGKEAEAAIQDMMLQVPDVQIPAELLLPDFAVLLRSFQAKMDQQPPVLIPAQFKLVTPGGLGPRVPDGVREIPASVVNNNTTIIYPPGVTPPAVTDASNKAKLRDGNRTGLRIGP